MGSTTSDSTPPRLAASKKRRTLSQNCARPEAAFQVEGEHRAEAAHLALGEFVIGVRREAGIVDARDLGMFFEIFRDDDRVFALAFYSNGERS